MSDVVGANPWTPAREAGWKTPGGPATSYSSTSSAASSIAAYPLSTEPAGFVNIGHLYTPGRRRTGENQRHALESVAEVLSQCDNLSLEASLPGETGSMAGVRDRCE